MLVNMDGCRRQQSGQLIIVSSIAGKRGIPFMGAYAATKFAQVGLAESLRAKEAEGVISLDAGAEEVASVIFALGDGIGMQLLSDPDWESAEGRAYVFLNKGTATE